MRRQAEFRAGPRGGAENGKVMSMAESWNVRDQFNKQATKFDNWTMTQDEKTHQFLLEFYDISATDKLLDFACGTGDCRFSKSGFTRFCFSGLLSYLYGL